MKSIFIMLAMAVLNQNWAASSSLDLYFDYQNRYPETFAPIGNSDLGEIEIILNKEKMEEIEQAAGRTVGVIAEDDYWLWINDAVRFSNGKCGVYGRMMWRQSLTGATGVAVMAMFPNGKIALNRNFRHATRTWEYELPRGLAEIGEAIEDAAVREVMEETGMVIDHLELFGCMATDSGVINAVIPVFFAKVIGKEEAQPEDSESIASVDSFSIEQLNKGYLDGFLEADIDGEIWKIPLRDPFLAFALFHLSIRGYR